MPLRLCVDFHINLFLPPSLCHFLHLSFHLAADFIDIISNFDTVAIKRLELEFNVNIKARHFQARWMVDLSCCLSLESRFIAHVFCVGNRNPSVNCGNASKVARRKGDPIFLYLLVG